MNKKLAKQVTDFVSTCKFDDIYTVNGLLTISTYKSMAAPGDKPKVLTGNVVCLTVKQASILGLHILEQLNKLAYEKGFTIFTPLAGAIYSRDAVKTMMEDPVIKRTFQRGEVLIDCINKSAQNDGQFLKNSRADVAAACVIVGTAAVK